MPRFGGGGSNNDPTKSQSFLSSNKPTASKTKGTTSKKKTGHNKSKIEVISASSSLLEAGRIHRGSQFFSVNNTGTLDGDTAGMSTVKGDIVRNTY